MTSDEEDPKKEEEQETTTTLCEEDRKRVEAVEWWHSLKFGDVVTKGRGDMTVVNHVEAYLPRDLKGKSVLDIGCWDGFFSFYAEEHGAERVVSIDKQISEGIKLACELKGSKIVTKEVNMFDFEPDEEFDVVLYLGVFYHVDRIVESFQRVFSWTKKNGEVYVEGDMLFGRLNRYLPLPQWMRLSKDPKAPPNKDFWLPTLSALKALMEYVGFQDVEVLGFLYSRVLLRAKKK